MRLIIAGAAGSSRWALDSPAPYAKGVAKPTGIPLPRIAGFHVLDSDETRSITMFVRIYSGRARLRRADADGVSVMKPDMWTLGTRSFGLRKPLLTLRGDMLLYVHHDEGRFVRFRPYAIAPHFV